MLKVAELALDAAVAAVVTARAAGGTEIADDVGDVAAKAGTDIAAPTASTPAPTVTSRTAPARDARFRMRPRRTGLPWRWLVAALSLFSCTVALFLLSVSAKLLTIQIPIRREYRDRFTGLAGQIKAAALTPRQTSPTAQFRDIERAVPVTTLTPGYRPGAEPPRLTGP